MNLPDSYPGVARRPDRPSRAACAGYKSSRRCPSPRRCTRRWCRLCDGRTPTRSGPSPSDDVVAAPLPVHSQTTVVPGRDVHRRRGEGEPAAVACGPDRDRHLVLSVITTWSRRSSTTRQRSLRPRSALRRFPSHRCFGVHFLSFSGFHLLGFGGLHFFGFRLVAATVAAGPATASEESRLYCHRRANERGSRDTK